MQTFLPSADFAASAASLDRMRLGKQRVEAFQILKALVAPSGSGWRNHPAVKMWRGYEGALVQYTHAICGEWKRRSYKDTVEGKVSDLAATHGINIVNPVMPPWLGRPDLHLSHQSNLVRKLPDHYGALWPDVPATLEYVWPG